MFWLRFQLVELALAALQDEPWLPGRVIYWMVNEGSIRMRWNLDTSKKKNEKTQVDVALIND